MSSCKMMVFCAVRFKGIKGLDSTFTEDQGNVSLLLNCEMFFKMICHVANWLKFHDLNWPHWWFVSEIVSHSDQTCHVDHAGPRSSRWARTLMNFQAGKFQFFFGDASAWKMRHFFMQALLKLCHCKRVYASKQGDSFATKPLNTNGRSACQKGIVGTNSSCPKKFGPLHPVNSWGEQHGKPPEEERFNQEKFSFRPWFMRSACQNSYIYTDWIPILFILHCSIK